MKKSAFSFINPRSIALILLAWFVLQIGGLFTPGLLDDVDSVYIEIAREMLHRHDFVTPYIDGIRFFDKPPLMYWMAAASMRVFGEFDWAARLPLALGMLALLLAIYALGLRLFAATSPAAHPDRGALYSALAFATAIGPYLYTRFYIPDILIALWMTLSVHLFLIALERLKASRYSDASASRYSEASASRYSDASASRYPEASASGLYGGKGGEGLQPLGYALLPCTLFAATLALNLLTKGLIGILFPIAFVLLYLALTRQLRLLPKFHLIPSILVFVAIALPWHILAALRNPAIPMPPGVNLPAKAGWAWFYLYNEHVARFLASVTHGAIKRVPVDYGQTPVWLFWLYAIIWIFPWAVFLPAAIAQIWPRLKRLRTAVTPDLEAPLTLTLWAGIVLIFFSISSRQEYYSIPALPALALLAGGLLARADRTQTLWGAASQAVSPLEVGSAENSLAATIFLHRWLLLPIVSLAAAVCAFFAIMAPQPQPGTDLATLLSNNPELYNLSLGHIFDLTGPAMGLFRIPLTAVAIGMAVIGPISYGLRRKGSTYTANLTMAAGMTLVLLAAHEGLVRFNPILGSKDLALAIVAEQQLHAEAGDVIAIDGELTSGSTLLFYTRQPVQLVNGRVNGPWFGSFWPDAPPIFETEASLRRLWAGPHRVFLMTPTPTSRQSNLQDFAPVHTLASAGGKTILTNR